VQARVGEEPVAVEALDVVVNVLPSPQMLTSSSFIARTSIVPVTARPIGVVLK
jgi:hypothetical protein